MTTENWERMTEAFAGGRQRFADEREPYLDEVCAGDPDLRTEVQARAIGDGEAHEAIRR